MQEKSPATEKCMCCQSSFPCDDGQLDLEEASWPSKGQLGDGVQRLADWLAGGQSCCSIWQIDSIMSCHRIGSVFQVSAWRFSLLCLTEHCYREAP